MVRSSSIPKQVEQRRSSTKRSRTALRRETRIPSPRIKNMHLSPSKVTPIIDVWTQIEADVTSYTLLPPFQSPKFSPIWGDWDEKLLKRPRKLKGDPEKWDRGKYYRFHKDHGHDTSSYFELKCQIEELIQNGHFKKFVGKPKSNFSEKKDERRCSRTLRLAIFRGPSGSKSGNKRKELAQEARHDICVMQVWSPTCLIFFSDSNLDGAISLIMMLWWSLLWLTMSRSERCHWRRSIRQHFVLDYLHYLGMD